MSQHDSSANNSILGLSTYLFEPILEKPPLIITLNGNISMTIGQDETFNDPGITSVVNELNSSLSNYTVSIDFVKIDTLPHTNVDNITGNLGIYTLTYNVTDEFNNTGRADRYVTVVDNIPPVITLINGNISLNQGDSFVDPGITVTDISGDPNIDSKPISKTLVDSNNIVQSLTSFTQTTGIYTLTYSVTDNANNTGTAIRQITIIDNIPPVLTINGGNITQPAGMSFIDPGLESVTDIGGDPNINNRTIVKTIVDSYNNIKSIDTFYNVPGTYTLTYSVTDNANNTGTASREISITNSEVPNEYPLSGLKAYYKRGDWDIENNTWPNKGSSGNDAVLSGSGFTESNKAGYGATVNVSALEGTTSSTISFGNIIENEYTVCSLTRYTGNNKQRILQGDPTWSHGHHDGKAGVIYYHPVTLTPWQNNVIPDTDWVVMCATNSGLNVALVNGENMWYNTDSNNGNGNISVYINGGATPNEFSDFAIVELVVWNRGLTEAEMRAVSNYMMNSIYPGPEIPSIYPSGLNAWYAPGDFNISNNKWRDRSGNSQDAVLSGVGFVSSNTSGHGSYADIPALEGTTTSSISFGNIIENEYTVCSITRYTGNNKQRILQGDPTWAHGHHDGKAGVIYYHPVTLTSWQNNVSPDTDWVVMCATNSGLNVALVNGENMWHNTDSNNGNGNISVYINGGATPNELSDFAIVELAVWNRGLTETEMRAVSNYMISRLNFAKFSIPSAYPENGLFAWYVPGDYDILNKVWPDRSGNNNTAVLSGSGHISTYNSGNGSSDNVYALEGTTSSIISFGEIISSDTEYTVCSITRYTGGTNKRILVGDHPSGSNNWLHGHYENDKTGVVHYGNWNNFNVNISPNTNWCVVIASNSSTNLFLNGNNIGSNIINDSSVNSIWINGGDQNPGQESDFAIMELAVWNRALSESEMLSVSNYMMARLNNYQTFATPSAYPSGMKAWYAPEDFKINIPNPIWPDRSGNGNHAILSGSEFTSSNNIGNGSISNISALEGTILSSISFGNVIENDFTICSITRYTGDTNQNRILTDPNGWSHGHHSSGTGVAYYGSWMTAQQDHVVPDTNWVVMCGTNSGSNLKLVNGINVGTSTGGGGSTSLFINPKNSDNPWNMPGSDFAIIELAIWPRGLTEEEIKNVSEYMISRINLPSYPSGMVAYYAPGDFDISNNIWNDRSGNDNHAILSGDGYSASIDGYAIEGSKSSIIKFGNIIKEEFTICSVTKYIGENKKRILNGNNDKGVDWLHGHYDGHTGVVYYDFPPRSMPRFHILAPGYNKIHTISTSNSNAGYFLTMSRNGNRLIEGNSSGLWFYEWNSLTNSWNYIKEESVNGWGDVYLSDDGSRYIVGENTNNPSRVLIYSWNTNTVSPLAIIESDSNDNNTFWGEYVEMSGDGNVVAFSARTSDTPYTDAGHVEVWRATDNTGTLWEQIPSSGDNTKLSGGIQNDQYGYHGVHLSNDGMHVAIAAPGSKTVSVYQYNNITEIWSIMGASILCPTMNTWMRLQLSANGKRLAIAVIYVASGNEKVNIYDYNETSNTWEDILTNNNPIIGPNTTSSGFGRDMAMTSDGNVIVIGARSAGGTTGGVWAYGLDGTTWEQIGSENYGLNGSYMGSGIAITSDGLKYVVGANGNGEVLTYVTDYNIPLDILYHGKSLPFHVSVSKYTSIGEIVGENAGDYAGSVVKLSDDGNILAVAAYMPGAGRGGSVRVFHYDSVSEVWNPRLPTLVPDTNYERLGTSMAMSFDGSIIAVGGPSYNGNYSESGRVKVWKWNDNTNLYVPMGQDLNDGTQIGDRFGYTLALSGNGQVLVVGSNKYPSGYFRSYSYNVGNNTWDPVGQIFNQAYSVASLELNINGNILAVGTARDNSEKGKVRLYEWDETASNWLETRPELVGDDTKDHFGFSIAMNNDGSIIAVGSSQKNNTTTTKGLVRIWEWSVTNTWVERGNGIYGEAEGDKSGWSVGMNNDGNIIIVGARYNDAEGGNDNGHARVYVWDAENNSWEQAGLDIDGVESGDESGWSVAINNDGTVIAVGARTYDAPNKGNAGHALVYAAEINTNKLNVLPSPHEYGPPSDMDWKWPAEHNVVCKDYHPSFGGGVEEVGGYGQGPYRLINACDSVDIPYEYNSLGVYHSEWGLGGAGEYIDFIFTFEDANTWCSGYRQMGHSTWGGGSFTKDIEIYTGDENFGPWTLVTTDTHDMWNNNGSNIFSSDVTTTEWVPTAPSKYLLVRTLMNHSGAGHLTVHYLQLKFAVGGPANPPVTNNTEWIVTCGTNAIASDGNQTILVNGDIVNIPSESEQEFPYNDYVYKIDNTIEGISVNVPGSELGGWAGSIEKDCGIYFKVETNSSSWQGNILGLLTHNPSGAYSFPIMASWLQTDALYFQIVHSSSGYISTYVPFTISPSTVYEIYITWHAMSSSHPTAPDLNDIVIGFRESGGNWVNRTANDGNNTSDTLELSNNENFSLENNVATSVIGINGNGDINSNGGNPGTKVIDFRLYNKYLDHNESAPAPSPVVYGGNGNILLSINDGPTNECSDFAILELAIWPRALTSEEMKIVTNNMIKNIPEKILQFKEKYDGYMLMGDFIYGRNETQNNDFGTSVTCNKEGNVIAIGAENHDSGRGVVCVYEWDGTSWQPRGFNIVGENTGDNCGSSISLNDDGNIIAVGATLSDGGNGSVRIFEWDGIRWQIRDKLTGSSGDAHGYSVAINSDGTVVVFGGYGANGGAGEVRIHAWNNSTYEKRGNYIPGESTLNIADNFGTSVAINGDGTIIAGGAMYADPNNNTAAGNVRVFSYNDTSDSWDIRGTFNGVNAHDYTNAVSLSKDGNIVAVGSPGYDDAGNAYGQVFTYEWNGNEYISRGTIIGENAHAIGYDVALNGDGNVLAISAKTGDYPETNETRDNIGYVVIYTWDGTTWSQFGSKHYGDSANDHFGWSVAINHSGTMFISSSKSQLPEYARTYITYNKVNIPSAYPEDGLFAWYAPGDFNLENYSWPDRSGNNNDAVLSGTGFNISNKSGHGSLSNVIALEGSESSIISFGEIISSDAEFTVCSITRYTGGTNRRILNGYHSSGANWLHGHWGDYAGVIHYNSFNGSVESRVNPITNWIVTIASNTSSHLFVNGINYGNTIVNSAVSSLWINGGDHMPGNGSDFAIMELAVWNRGLSESEMLSVSNYMMHRLNHTPLLKTLPLPASYPSGMKAWYAPGGWNVQNNIWYDETGNGFDAVLSGTGFTNKYYTNTDKVGSGNWYVDTETGSSNNNSQQNIGANNIHVLSGTTSSNIEFGNVIDNEFTVCSITRYSGTNKKRILNGGNGTNWMHGHWNGATGVVWYEDNYGNLSSSTSTNRSQFNYTYVDNNERWQVVCATNTSASDGKQTTLANGINVSVPGGGVGGIDLNINGDSYPAERSDYEIVELAIWPRALTEYEMKQVSRIMMMKINMPFFEYDSYENGKVIFNYYGGVTSTDWITVRHGTTYGAYGYPDYNNYKEPNGQVKVNHARTGDELAEVFYANGPQSLYGPIEFTV